MNQKNILDIPKVYPDLLQECEDIGFSMPSDVYIGTLLKTLITSKPNSNFLELGTGTGLSLSWMIDGMDENSKLTTVDNDPELIHIAEGYFGKDERIEIICQEGSAWIKNYSGEKFDLIFADAWPGKFSEVDEVLELVKAGGFYVVDDMTAQSDWPEGHQEKVDLLIDYLENREDFNLTKLNWSTGLIVAVKNKNK